jgi:hypothetical protein
MFEFTCICGAAVRTAVVVGRCTTCGRLFELQWHPKEGETAPPAAASPVLRYE